MIRICIIIPAYNEEKSLPLLIPVLNDFFLSDTYKINIVVINDGSIDNTAKVAANLECIVINLEANLGIGGAVQTGLKYALTNEFDLAIQIDADGQHPPHELKKIIEAYSSGDSNIIIGSRFISNEGFQSTTLRRIGISYFQF